MSPEVQAIFEDWSVPVFLTVAVLVCAILYTSGWVVIRDTRRTQFPVWRLFAFLLGLAVLWLAIGSPLDGFADALLSAHMVQHLLLMSFVPPLLLLGLPVVPLLRGVPRGILVTLLAPLFRLGWMRRLGYFLTLPLVAWLAMNVAFFGWHVPAAYNFALEHEHWHEFEHGCFLGSSLLFWYPVIRPWPASAHNPRWYLLPYLIAADLVNTALSAFLAFCDRPVYSYYVMRPNPFQISPVSDQRIGAVIMWVFGSMIFLLPCAVITVRLLQQGTKLQAAHSN